MKGASTVIPANTAISGRLEGAEDVAVYGKLSGTVQLDGDLFVDEGATVQADLTLKGLTIEGILVGDVTASDTVELTASAQVIGDIRAPQVIVAEGARFRGLIDMGDVETEGKGQSSRQAPRPAARSAPAPRKATPPPAPKKPPVVEEEDDDEPELPKAAGGKKKVAVKKRK